MCLDSSPYDVTRSYSYPRTLLPQTPSITVSYARHTSLCSTAILVSSSNNNNNSLFLANSMVERCRTDDLMPNVPISCLPPSSVDPEVQGLNVIIDCPQPLQVVLGRPTCRPPPISANNDRV